MTQGEKMIWAAAFAAAQGKENSTGYWCVIEAYTAVMKARHAVAECAGVSNPDRKAMLAEMLSDD